MPLTEDLRAIKNHLVSTRKQSIDDVATNNGDVQAYRNLCSSTLALIILLNRKRTGEASKVNLKHIEEMQNGTVINDEISFEIRTRAMQDLQESWGNNDNSNNNVSCG